MKTTTNPKNTTKSTVPCKKFQTRRKAFQIKVRHSKMQTDLMFNSKRDKSYRYKNIQRVTDKQIDKAGFVTPIRSSEKVSASGIPFFPELLNYLIELDGCPKNLFLYLVLYCMKPESNEFIWNQQVIDDFNKTMLSCSNGNISYSPATIKRGIRTLVDMNLIINVKRKTYKINPLAICHNNQSRRATLINEYSNIIINNGKDCEADFYPTYGLK